MTEQISPFHPFKDDKKMKTMDKKIVWRKEKGNWYPVKVEEEEDHPQGK